MKRHIPPKVNYAKRGALDWRKLAGTEKPQPRQLWICLCTHINTKLGKCEMCDRRKDK